MIEWSDRWQAVSRRERVAQRSRHGIGDAYPLWEVDAQEECFWKGCSVLALPISFDEGRWVRLCEVHARAVHAAHEEGLRIDVHWQGDIHPVIFVTA